MSDNDERPEEMPTLDEVKLSFFAPEATRHNSFPRVGDVIEVRISTDGAEGLSVWNEKCFVAKLEEAKFWASAAVARNPETR